MQQIRVKSGGRNYLVNTAGGDDMGVGSGFAVGQLVMKSTDGKWYVTTASGSAGSVGLYVSQSALPFTSSAIYSQGAYTASVVGYQSFFEQNFPYQIVASNNGLAYQVFLTGTAPSVTVTVSQSAYCTASIRAFSGAIIDLSKPYFFLQNITNGDYYRASLSTTGGVTTIVVDQNAISQSWVHPIY